MQLDTYWINCFQTEDYQRSMCMCELVAYIDTSVVDVDW